MSDTAYPTIHIPTIGSDGTPSPDVRVVLKFTVTTCTICRRTPRPCIVMKHIDGANFAYVCATCIHNLGHAVTGER